MNRAANSLNAHPYKLRTRDHIARYVCEFMQKINPSTIRTLSLPGYGFDFESIVTHNLYNAPRLKDITRVCVEKKKATYMVAPVQVPIEKRENVEKHGSSAVWSYKTYNDISVSNHYVYDDMESILRVSNGERRYRWEDSVYNANLCETVEMDLIWLDYYGSYDNNISTQLTRLANVGSGLSGLIFVTFECRGRHATQFTKANAPDRKAGSAKKAVYQAEEVASDLKGLKQLRQILYVEYVGEGNTPMVLVGFSWQKKRDLSTQRGETIPVIKMEPYHGGDQWPSLGGDMKRDIQKAAREAVKPKATDEQKEIIDDVCLEFCICNQSRQHECNDKRDELLAAVYPELVQFIPAETKGKREGKGNWAGVKQRLTSRGQGCRKCEKKVEKSLI